MFKIAIGPPLLLAATALAQQTQVVKVKPGGSFSPRTFYIKSGDTIRWEQLARTDSIIPAAGTDPYPAICSKVNPYDRVDANGFTGPMPFAPSGVCTLAPPDRGYSEVTGVCPGGVVSRTAARCDNGKSLGVQEGDYEATLDSTWKSPSSSGVFIRQASPDDRLTICLLRPNPPRPYSRYRA